MNKKTILYMLLDLVILIVFNTVFFAVGTAGHPASVWISYVFIHLSFIMIVATPILIKKSSKAKVFGASLSDVSVVYFFVEFIVGLIFVLIGSESFKTALVFQIIIAGIYAIMLLFSMIANEDTDDNTEEQEKEVFDIEDAKSKVKMLIGNASDKKANKEIEKIYELINSSPSQSHQSVELLEMDVRNLILELEKATNENQDEKIIEITKEITSVIEERNRRLKKYKVK